jgi:hypothetical protein
LKDIV